MSKAPPDAPPESDAFPGAPHPRLATRLIGHAAAETEMLATYREGRLAHAWLIGGREGVGKATLAWRFARFVLANPDPGAPAARAATSLAVAPDHPAARQLAALAHPDFALLRREWNPKAKAFFSEIRVEDLRDGLDMFHLSAAFGGWRVAIVDSAEDLNRSGANSLLKIVEEPPPRSLILIVAHRPGQAPATIRSRCRRLLLRPLDPADVVRAVAAATGRNADDTEVQDASAAAEGSVARAISLLDGPALALRQRVLDLFAQLPDPDPRALHALGDALGGSEPATLAAFMDLVNGWLSARLTDARPAPRLARTAEVWEKVNRAARDVETYNLERKPLVFAVFGLLADAARAGA